MPQAWEQNPPNESGMSVLNNPGSRYVKSAGEKK